MQVDRFALGGTKYGDVGGKIFQREKKKKNPFFPQRFYGSSRNKTEDTGTQTHANTDTTNT